MIAERDWTKGSIIRNLLSLSWPMIVFESSWAIGITLDMVWVGKLGATSIAGMGVAFSLVMMAYTLLIGVITGAVALVARFVGAGDVKGANHVLQQAFVISIVYSVLLTLVGVLLAEPILRLFGLQADVVAEGTAYLRIMFAGWLAPGLFEISFRVMQAAGDTVTPMKIIILMMFVHILLSPFLVFGWWLFPQLGVRGAALTYVISHTIGMSLCLWILSAGRTRVRLTLKDFRLDLSTIWRIMKIGIPASIMGAQRTFGDLMFAKILASFGTLAIAGHSLVRRIDMMLQLPGGGLSGGAGVLVGQNLGAGQPERAEKSAWRAVSLVASFILLGSVVILLGAEKIVAIFNSNPDLVAITSVFLRIEVVGLVMFALYTVFQRCLSGAGDTLSVMLISLGDLWLVRIPLAIILPRVTNLGVYGVRWAIVTGMVVGAIVCTLYFRMGRWKRKKV